MHKAGLLEEPRIVFFNRRVLNRLGQHSNLAVRPEYRLIKILLINLSLLLFGVYDQQDVILVFKLSGFHNEL